MKFGNLLKKELGELLTPQAIFSMIFTCVLLICMGQFMGTAMDDAINNTTVNIMDLDGSDFSKKMLEKLPEYGTEPKIVVNSEGVDLYTFMESNDITSLVVIGEGFGESVVNGSEPATLSCYSLINKSGMAASMSQLSASSLTASISDYVGDYLEHEKIQLSEEELALIKEPVVAVEYTASNGKTVQVSPDALSSILMTQSLIAPMAVFILVLMASQMIMTAISTEKIDKTLETLLSAPVSRLTVLASKMTAALIVALLNCASMMVGFVFYIQGMTGSAIESETAQAEAAMTAELSSLPDAMAQLGLSLSAGSIVLFGIQLFLTIAIGLSISLILGAMATDVKSVQTLVLPVMMMTMIPFFVTMFSDVNSLSPVMKLVMYLIPFTHTYTAMGNMMFGHMDIFWGGLIYQLVFFTVCMYLAVKMFTTDLLFTMSLNFGGRGKAKKGGASANENA